SCSGVSCTSCFCSHHSRLLMIAPETTNTRTPPMNRKITENTIMRTLKLTSWCPSFTCRPLDWGRNSSMFGLQHVLELGIVHRQQSALAQLAEEIPEPQATNSQKSRGIHGNI